MYRALSLLLLTSAASWRDGAAWHKLGGELSGKVKLSNDGKCRISHTEYFVSHYFQNETIYPEKMLVYMHPQAASELGLRWSSGFDSCLRWIGYCSTSSDVVFNALERSRSCQRWKGCIAPGKKVGCVTFDKYCESADIRYIRYLHIDLEEGPLHAVLFASFPSNVVVDTIGVDLSKYNSRSVLVPIFARGYALDGLVKNYAIFVHKSILSGWLAQSQVPAVPPHYTGAFSVAHLAAPERLWCTNEKITEDECMGLFNIAINPTSYVEERLTPSRSFKPAPLCLSAFSTSNRHHLLSQYGADWFILQNHFSAHFANARRDRGITHVYRYIDFFPKSVRNSSATWVMDQCMAWPGICVITPSKAPRFRVHRHCRVVTLCLQDACKSCHGAYCRSLPCKGQVSNPEGCLSFQQILDLAPSFDFMTGRGGLLLHALRLVKGFSSSNIRTVLATHVTDDIVIPVLQALLRRNFVATQTLGTSISFARRVADDVYPSTNLDYNFPLAQWNGKLFEDLGFNSTIWRSIINAPRTARLY